VSATNDLSAELARLRILVGPSEVAYATLLADVERAHSVAKQAALDAGELRGKITEMSVQLSRARQDQDLLQRRVEMNGLEQVMDRGKRRWASSVVPRLKKITDP
jgi:hypothetical protein